MLLKDALIRSREWERRWREALTRFHTDEISVHDLYAEIKLAFHETCRLYACPKCSLGHVTNPDAKRCRNGHTLPPEFYMPWKGQ